MIQYENVRRLKSQNGRGQRRIQHYDNLPQERKLWEIIKDKQPIHQPLLKVHQPKIYQDYLVSNPVQLNSRLNHTFQNQYEENADETLVSPPILSIKAQHQPKTEKQQSNAKNSQNEDIDGDNYSEDSDFEEYNEKKGNSKQNNQTIIPNQTPNFPKNSKQSDTHTPLSGEIIQSAYVRTSNTSMKQSRNEIKSAALKGVYTYHSGTQTRNATTAYQRISNLNDQYSTFQNNNQRNLLFQNQKLQYTTVSNFNKTPISNNDEGSQGSMKRLSSFQTMEQLKTETEKIKTAFEPSSASYTIKGQFDMIRDESIKKYGKDTTQFKENLKKLWSHTKERCQPLLVSKIQPPGPGQYINSMKYSSLQRKGYSFSKDTRIFDKMTKVEISNMLKQREKQYVQTFVEQSVYGQTGTTGFSNIQQEKTPDLKRQKYSFPQQSRVNNVRSWDIKEVRAWPRCFYE